jgi:lysophospholipase L1-like esterase
LIFDRKTLCTQAGDRMPVEKVMTAATGALSARAAQALAFAAVLALSMSTLPAEEAPHKQSYREFRRDIFALSRLDSAAIVMLGDSITEAGPWDELTGCRSIANRGIGGDTTAGVLARFDGVTRLHPRAVFLMIGVNDVTLGVAREKTLASYRGILDRLNAANLYTFAAYVLPVARSYAKWRNNAAIANLNEGIGGLIAGRPDTSALDLRPLMRDEHGYLREDLSYDGLHLDAKGYAIWRDAIAADVARFCS